MRDSTSTRHEAVKHGGTLRTAGCCAQLDVAHSVIPLTAACGARRGVAHSGMLRTRDVAHEGMLRMLVCRAWHGFRVFRVQDF
eukprot:364396-Chlamydomonas_euryale.AAC.2